MAASLIGTQNGTTEITMLADLITSSVQDIISEYQKAGHSVPSLHSCEAGPFDAPEMVTAKLAKAIQIVEAACAQLCFTVANPGHTITNKAYGFIEPSAMLVVTNTKIADILLGKSEGLPVEELAKVSGLDPEKLGRILRMLATKHVYEEVKPNVFANNRLSMQLLSKNPVSSLVGCMTDEVFKSSAHLAENLTDPGTAFSTSPNESAFKRTYGATPFDFYATVVPVGENLNARFGQAMVGWGEVTGRAMLPKVYAWEDVAPNSTICDVGGGNGHATLGLVKQYPKLKVIVQDLPGVIEQGKAYWSSEYPAAIGKQRVQFVAMDFFVDAPVKDCNFYYLRHVLHDWPSAECSKILTNIRKAMRWYSRLLIHEFVLQHAVRDSSKSARQAPEPLLANYGMGRLRLYQQDINMMTFLNSKERTLSEFIELGEKNGFKFEKLWESGEAGLMEFTAA